jgi:hypothetical protein
LEIITDASKELGLEINIIQMSVLTHRIDAQKKVQPPSFGAVPFFLLMKVLIISQAGNHK